MSRVMCSIAGLAIAAAMALSVGPAMAQSKAGCVNKGAVATSGSAQSAQWFAFETMVQSVSWGLWPGFLANGQVAGYKVTNKKYRCKPDGSQVTCHARATFCKSG